MDYLLFFFLIAAYSLPGQDPGEPPEEDQDDDSDDEAGVYAYHAAHILGQRMTMHVHVYHNIQLTWILRNT